ncbi:MAG: cobalamin-dependent protein [Clostridia bacterium]|nr:cobalamin-dependent protein [Clostridia bacterium]
MNKKKIYLVQANYTYSGSAHLPYAVGMLQAFSMKDERVMSVFSFEQIIFERKEPEVIMNDITDPSVIGFSCYVWNYEYNKKIASMVKEKYPECKIIFGGHHVREGCEQLEKYSFIDVLIHGEGEEAFRDVLLSFAGKMYLSEVKNISYRENGKCFNTEKSPCLLCDYPSPYLEGVFDSLIADHPQYEFIALIETNRGCPYSCAYCDWGCLASKLRLFPMERIQKEIDWLCDNKIVGCGGTDSNFGIIERDEEITDMLVEARVKRGYPKKFQTSYAKNSNDRVFRIGKKFEDCGMSKGVTISYQTMSPVAAENVLRKNIPIETFSQLMNKYNECGIPTYTELILGLPGETVESLKTGIDELLRAGQHYSLYVHNCELLPCSTMADADYMKKYDISATKLPLNEPHREPSMNDSVTEYSRLVTKTYSMSNADWIEMNIFAYLVQSFHHLGLLRFVALYLYHSQSVSYDSFYSGLIAFLRENPYSVAGKALALVEDKLNGVIKDNVSITVADTRFGTVEWPLEELVFLMTVYERDKFYEEITPLIYEFVEDKALADELIDYQRFLIKYPEITCEEKVFNHDFSTYFESALNGTPISLEKNKIKLTLEKTGFPLSWQDYARFVVWYGRKSGSNFYKFRKEDMS